jgi:short-subunit dehydrogenase
VQLNNKTIFLTGAASGLGRELALQLDQAGSHLLLVDHDATGLKDLQATLTHPAQVFVCDLSQPAERTRLINELTTLATRISVFIHCAGIGSHSRLEQLTPDEVNRLMQVNTVAPLELTAGLLPLLPKNEPGGVVFIGSLAGELTTPSMSLYSASKAALHAFSRAISIELAARGHFSLLVILGALKNTNFTSSIHHPAKGQPGWYRRLDADPRDVARAIVRAIQHEQTIQVYPGWYGPLLMISKLLAPFTQAITRLSYKKLVDTHPRP